MPEQQNAGWGLGRAAERLAALGITKPEVAAAVGSYVPAVRDGNLVLTSGQLPFVDGALEAAGKVGADVDGVDPEQAQRLARRCTVNALAAVHAVLGGLEQVDQVVKVVGFVASDPSFTAQPTVVNGASDLLAEVFGDAGRHARSAVGVAVLPLDAPVEVELTVRAR